MTPNPACLVPVPFHCDPKPTVANIVVNGNVDLFDVLLVILVILGCWALWRYIRTH